MTREEPSTPNGAARLAGGLYLGLVPLGVFSFVYVPAAVVVAGDAASTCANLVGSEGLFRWGIASHLASQVVVVFLALTLYRVLRPVRRGTARAMLVLALLCVPISFAAEAGSLAALHVATGADAQALASARVQAQVVQLLDLQRSGVLLAQVFWGLWLLPMAALVFRSGFLPRWLAVPLVIAAAGYLWDSGAHVLSSAPSAVSRFTALCELPLPLWLLVKGVDVPGWRRQASG